MKVRKAVIPAAGLGTRFLPATKAMPKEMVPIVDKPTIQFIVEDAKKSGIEDILIVTGKNKRSIEDHFDANPELEQDLEEKHLLVKQLELLLVLNHEQLLDYHLYLDLVISYLVFFLSHLGKMLDKIVSLFHKLM